MSSAKNKKSEKLYWADNVRAFATIAVIVLHVASSISPDYPAISRSYFFTSVFFDSACRWSVPVFIMLTGSFALQNYDGRLTNFLIKMFYRIILPFIFWSIVYLLFFFWHELNNLKSTKESFAFIGKQFLSGTASHLWFVYLIVSMYITFPFLSKWTKVAKEKEYIFFLALWIFFLVVDPFLSPYNIDFSYIFFTGFIGYIVMGNYLFKTNRKINDLLLIILFFASIAYTVIRTYFISINTREYNEDFMENLSLNVCLMSFCVYLFFKNKRYFTHLFWRRVIDVICSNSYGIYLSHLLILNIFLSLRLNFHFIHPLFSIPIITFVCLLISCVLIIVMKKIPILKNLAG